MINNRETTLSEENFDSAKDNSVSARKCSVTQGFERDKISAENIRLHKNRLTECCGHLLQESFLRPSFLSGPLFSYRVAFSVPLCSSSPCTRDLDAKRTNQSSVFEPSYANIELRDLRDESGFAPRNVPRVKHRF